MFKQGKKIEIYLELFMKQLFIFRKRPQILEGNFLKCRRIFFGVKYKTVY